MRRRRNKNQKGFALLESLAFMMAFVILTAYCIDLFTVVHTGIISSTSARAYLFETLQHRSNIRYFRQENENGSDRTLDFASIHQRFHAVSDEDQSATDNVGIHAAGRKLTQVKDPIREMQSNALDAAQNETSTVQIKTGYGICIDSGCPQ